jgi:hypothetical protein
MDRRSVTDESEVHSGRVRSRSRSVGTLRFHLERIFIGCVNPGVATKARETRVGLTPGYLLPSLRD